METFERRKLSPRYPTIAEARARRRKRLFNWALIVSGIISGAAFALLQAGGHH